MCEPTFNNVEKPQLFKDTRWFTSLGYLHMIVQSPMWWIFGYLTQKMRFFTSVLLYKKRFIGFKIKDFCLSKTAEP